VPLSIQNAGLSAAIAAALGIKGYVPLTGVDERVYPQLLMSDLTVGPFRSLGVPGSRYTTAAAAAGLYSFIGAVAGATRILQVEQIRVYNPTGATQHYTINRVPPATVALGTIRKAPFLLNNLERANSSTSNNQLSSQLRDCTFAASGGTAIADVAVPAATSAVVSWPYGCGPCLWGNDPAGLSSIGIFSLLVNEAFMAAFDVVEFTAP